MVGNGNRLTLDICLFAVIIGLYGDEPIGAAAPATGRIPGTGTTTTDFAAVAPRLISLWLETACYLRMAGRCRRTRVADYVRREKTIAVRSRPQLLLKAERPNTKSPCLAR